ncbi:MAG: hypothetical protein AAB439_04025 [Patescibacteria group bacterium]
MKLKTKFRILEFVLFGVVTSVIENMASLFLFKDHELGISLLIPLLFLVIPFAVLEELVVDHPSFWTKVCNVLGIKVNTNELRS